MKEKLRLSIKSSFCTHAKNKHVEEHQNWASRRIAFECVVKITNNEIESFVHIHIL